MVDVDYLVLAVRNIYNNQKDYQIIIDWLDTLFITKRIKFELKAEIEKIVKEMGPA